MEFPISHDLSKILVNKESKLAPQGAELKEKCLTAKVLTTSTQITYPGIGVGLSTVADSKGLSTLVQQARLAWLW